MFITNISRFASLVVKGKIGQTSKSLKYYDSDCKILFFLSMSLLKGPIVKTIIFLARVYFIFLKTCPRPTLKCIYWKSKCGR